MYSYFSLFLRAGRFAWLEVTNPQLPVWNRASLARASENPAQSADPPPEKRDFRNVGFGLPGSRLLKTRTLGGGLGIPRQIEASDGLIAYRGSPQLAHRAGKNSDTQTTAIRGSRRILPRKGKRHRGHSHRSSRLPIAKMTYPTVRTETINSPSSDISLPRMRRENHCATASIGPSSSTIAIISATRKPLNLRQAS